jgi:FSR family fosmidomycin resistance protein-like MFS transporter
MVALSASHAAVDFYQGSIAVLVPILVVQAGFSAAEATAVVLAATVGSAVAQPLFGALADRYQTFWLIPGSMLTAGVGFGCLGVLDSFRWILAAAALSGLGVAAYHPVAASLSRRVGHGTAASMSVFIAGGNIGLTLAPIVAAPVLIGLGTAASPLLALPGVVGGLALIVSRHWLLTDGHDRRVGLQRVDDETRDDWRSFGLLTLLTILRSGAYFGVSTMVGLLVIEELDAGTVTASWMLAGFLGIGVAATLAGGALADRWQRMTCVRLGFALTVPGIMLIAAAPNTGTVLAGVVIAGIGVFLPFSVQTTLGHEYLPQHIGTASGVTIGLSVSAGGAFAPLLGLVADINGPRNAMLVLLVLPLCALLISLALRDRHAGVGEPGHVRAAAPPR